MHMRLVMVATLALVCHTPADAATPPPGSPMAKGEHPRLFFTTADLEGIRTRIAGHYRSEFQAFVDLVTDPTQAPSQAARASWGAFNNAFLAALDPVAMRALGFRFAESRDTRQEFCQQAMTYARTLLPAIAAAVTQEAEELHAGFPDPKYFPAITTYDWCYTSLSQADRQAIVDAYVSAYDTKYRGKNLLSLTVNSQQMVANVRGASNLEDIMGVLGFWGDAYPAVSVQQTLYDAFHTMWFDRLFTELDRYYPHATGWQDASGGYFQTSFTSLMIPVGMMTSALDPSLPSKRFFSGFAEFVFGNLKPHSQQDSGCSSGTCPTFLERWGTMENGIDGFSCKNTLMNSGLLRVGHHPGAGLAKWLTTWEASRSEACASTVTRYGGAWTNAVLFWFLYGDRDIRATSPVNASLAKTLRLGLGEYSMKSGYGPTDSQVLFWAPSYLMYGHASFEPGHFSIHKFGDLILTAANDKSGDARISSGKENVFRNAIGIRKPSGDPLMAFDGEVLDPLFAARGLRSVRLAGRVTAEHIGPDVTFVGYDGALSWNPATVSSWQRGFARVFGPPDHEYVIVIDRVNTPGPASKVWKAWVPTQPAFVDGTASQPRPGKWLSTTARTLSVTNAQAGLETPNFEAARTHGRLFLRLLSPRSATISTLGGPGHEFQSGADDGTTPWGTPAMTPAMRAYLGWGRIEIVPQTSQPYDVFLSVMQFGDSQSLAAMTPTARLDATDGTMLGVHLRDPLSNWVFMFAQHPEQAGRVTSTRYSFVSAATVSHHLLADLAPSRSMYVGVTVSGGTTSVTVSEVPLDGAPSLPTTEDGLLRFSIDGGRVLGPPVPPGNIRAVVR